MRKNSIKNTRINMEVQRELSEIIRLEIKDPRVNGAMTSVVAVEVTPDLKYCKAYISVLGAGKRGDYRSEKRGGLYPPRACPPCEPAEYTGNQLCAGSVH